MVEQRTPFIAGNWKMNLDHLQAIAFVQKLSWSLSDAKHDFSQVEVAVFPPFTDLRSVQTLISADKLELGFGSQDVSQHDSGAYTGEISGNFLARLDVQYAIVGHSERRQFHGETDAVVGAKAAAAVRHSIVPIICVGETAEDLAEHGPSAVPVAQLREVLSSLSADADIVVAYEPVWAIGSGKAATAEQAEQVCSALRETLVELLGEERATATRILYGGSVKSENIARFMREPNIDGALVGGASLAIEEFSRIIQFKKHVGV
ncbi:triose-phosphate isomerase [Klugiella xanthotipulae]|uniref:Triosephosphate isomerase n=1 Tax=Klugiella xanthotipulae TaxID=244735 RepID=A0A543HST9_9MICO|nr:triose-phosphate isomerase [Klugiella xanthotipulae]TQM61349.1 triosephosphate isomerase [Klugiella xanthotipulae]